MDNEQFYEWLDNCPVAWHRDNIDEESASYTFILTED